jgi:hypothetical protein
MLEVEVGVVLLEGMVAVVLVGVVLLNLQVLLILVVGEVGIVK